jgi:hypothetical protein
MTITVGQLLAVCQECARRARTLVIVDVRIAALHVAPERKAPMVAVEQGQAEAGRGVVGDRAVTDDGLLQA